MSIHIKNASEIEGMRAAGRAAARVLEMIEPHVVPGVTTEYLDKLCHEFIVDELKAIPAALNYLGSGPYPFPKAICTSVNHVVCHGIPCNKVLKEGDIINLDTAVILNGFYGDTSKMFVAGTRSILAKRLIQVTQECMNLAIAEVKPGTRVGDLGAIIQEHAHQHHFSVVREYTGHGVGKTFHEPPEILHFGKRGTGVELQAGMTFTIEPMINVGKAETKVLPDGWTVVTRDKSLSAQWEHTILVTETGHEILTLRDEERL